ncbi:MAG: orotidine-5'-phosphate decarboxylase [candidate division WOR-3 bacterium]|nr:MAG: orotidine-5'-phosphate decarboxylase [candidate division WOR-3 bacterium]
MKDRLIVSLDLRDLGQIKEIVASLRGIVSFYKIGAIPFTFFGIDVIKMLKDEGVRVMFDLKYHDIPNTVARACEAASQLGVDFITLHTSGGFTMLEDAVKATLMHAEMNKSPAPKLLGITILTSLDEAYLKDLYGETTRSLSEQVVFLADLARSAGLDGVVASPHEIRLIREACGKDLVIVTPGVRLKEIAVSGDDQARTMTPKQAVQQGADYLVVGRPIVKAADPRHAAQQIIKEMEDGHRART